MRESCHWRADEPYKVQCVIDFDIADTWTTSKYLLWQWPLSNPDPGNLDRRSSEIFWVIYGTVLPTENIIRVNYYYYYDYYYYILLSTIFPL
jgi:hypothetical protein